MRFLVINTATNVIENVVEWNGISDWSPGAGKIAISHPEADMDWTYDGVDFTPPAVIVPLATADMVASERERRLGLGFDYDFGDARGVHRIGTTEADMKGWSEVTTLSNALLALGAGATPIPIVTDTGPVAVTATEWQHILIHAATAFRQPLWQASFTLQAMQPIPANFADDSHWPESGGAE